MEDTEQTKYMKDMADEYALAWNYCDGTGGVSKDVKEALKIWERLAHQEHSQSMFIINLSEFKFVKLLNEEGDIKNMLIEGSNKGDPFFQFALSNCYRSGELGIEINEPEAMRLAMLSAKAGYRDAQCFIGCCYINGRYGLMENINEGMRLLTLASEQGNIKAQELLGLLYITGELVEMNKEEGMRLLTLASDSGYLNACYFLACHYAEIDNEEKAQELLIKSAKAGHAKSIELLALINSEDSHIRPDSIEYLSIQ